MTHLIINHYLKPLIKALLVYGEKLSKIFSSGAVLVIWVD